MQYRSGVGPGGTSPKSTDTYRLDVAPSMLTYPSEYRTWSSMKQRCYNPNDTGYADYGGRGIRVCDEWRWSFKQFFEDMGPRPEGLSIDRIDNDGNYEPNNCRWATRSEQVINRRTPQRVQADRAKVSPPAREEPQHGDA